MHPKVFFGQLTLGRFLHHRIGKTSLKSAKYEDSGSGEVAKAIDCKFQGSNPPHRRKDGKKCCENGPNDISPNDNWLKVDLSNENRPKWAPQH
jgi:hypothetical protein